jgi:hypothetical protein
MPPVADAVLERIRADLRAGQKIAAIKTLREASRLSLAEAKVAVEKLQGELHAQAPQQYSVNASQGCGVTGVVILAAGSGGGCDGSRAGSALKNGAPGGFQRAGRSFFTSGGSCQSSRTGAFCE